MNIALEIIQKSNYKLVETYNGSEIYNAGDDTEPCYIVYNPIKEISFIIGLDDSKRCGYRKSYPATLQDARNYIDRK